MDEATILLDHRYGFRPPELWWRMRSSGFFTPLHENHLQLSDLSWMSVADMVAHRFPPDEIAGLVPFAQTGRGDAWCFYPGLEAGLAPVCFCPMEDEVAHVYAPDFAGFVYRATLEEYACTCLTEYHDPGRSLALLGDYSGRLATLLPPEWAARLQEVANRPLVGNEDGYYGTITASELAAIVAADLDHPLRDREFAHFRGN